MPEHHAMVSSLRKSGYNPLTNPATIDLNEDKAFDWLMKGAQPTDTIGRMLSYRGIMMKKHLQIGVIKGALTQDHTDAKLAEKKSKKKPKSLARWINYKAKADARKAWLAAEAKVKVSRWSHQEEGWSCCRTCRSCPAAEGEAPAAE